MVDRWPIDQKSKKFAVFMLIVSCPMFGLCERIIHNPLGTRIVDERVSTTMTKKSAQERDSGSPYHELGLPPICGVMDSKQMK